MSYEEFLSPYSIKSSKITVFKNRTSLYIRFLSCFRALWRLPTSLLLCIPETDGTRSMNQSCLYYIKPNLIGNIDTVGFVHAVIRQTLTDGCGDNAIKWLGKNENTRVFSGVFITQQSCSRHKTEHLENITKLACLSFRDSSTKLPRLLFNDVLQTAVPRCSFVLLR